MALLTILNSPLAPIAVVVAAVAYYLLPYFTQYSSLRHIPAPWPAQFSNLWLMRACRKGQRFAIVDATHKQLGPIVRIAPNHVSIANVDAIQAIYGHGNGFLKSDYYDSFVSIHRGLFNSRNRAEHTRKRKLISHTFAPKSILEFEPYINQNLQTFVQQWDSIVETGRKAGGNSEIDCLSWFNYLAFDMIADLAFGKPFGMLASGADIAEVRSRPDGPAIYAPACEIINRRGEVSATLGCLPGLKPYAKWLPDPFFRKGLEAVEMLAGIAIARVSDRLENKPDVDRKDLLARLMEGKDDNGEPLGRDELTAEALTQLIAGSDTTSNTSCALLYHVARTPHAMAKVQKEVDEAITDDCEVPTYEQVKSLPYLENVINETLRYHSTSGIGLPREIPADSKGLTFHGHYFPPGTILSVPTYSIHHSKEIWGPDADDFKPERWDSLTAEQKKAFNPFSYGPRSCIGRNLAEMQMKLIAATWIKRYSVVLRQEVMETSEGFLRKPVGLKVHLERR